MFFWAMIPCSAVGGVPTQKQEISFENFVGAELINLFPGLCNPEIHYPAQNNFTLGLGQMTPKKGKAIPVTGRGGAFGCETSRLPHFLDNRPTDDGEIGSLTRRPSFTPRKIPGTHFR
jgi:hypothetical protein